MKEKYPILSIYMPVYNSEEYVEKAIKSILNQTMSSFELFIYDDGSTDSSYLICKRIAENDERVILLSGENGNSINQMNKFLDKAKGQYVAFVDNDDLVEIQYFEMMITAIQKYEVDCAISSYNCIDQSDRPTNFSVPILDNNLVLDKYEILRMFLTTKKIEGFRWNKIYRKKFFDDNNIRFQNIFPADIPTEAKLLLGVEHVVLVNFPGYLYRQYKSSDVSSFSIKKLKGFLSAFKSVYEMACIPGLESDALYYYVWRSINILFEAFKGRLKNRYDIKEWKLFKKEFHINKWLEMSSFEAISCIKEKTNTELYSKKFLAKALVVYLYF